MNVLLVGFIDLNINPVLIDAGGFEVTWHGLFTALGIAAGVWLAIRLARQEHLNEDDAMSIAVVSVISGIIGARVLWVLEHTNEIRNVGDVFALTDGGISIYGAMIGGVLGGFIYVSIFKPSFPKWTALDVAAPGMILGQAIGRFGDFVNGEHWASQSGLPWAFRYTHPRTDGPWAEWEDGEPLTPWFRGSIGQEGEAPIPIHPVAGGYEQADAPWAEWEGGEPLTPWSPGSIGQEGEAPVPVHPVAGGYEPLLDFLILGLLLWMRRFPIGAGWRFVVYVLAYAAVRGTLAIMRTDEATVAGALSVPQLTAIVTGAAALLMAAHLLRRSRSGRGQDSKGSKGGGRGNRPRRLRGGLARG